MVRIRLRRVGAKKQPSYRVVVADSRAPRDGHFIETIGFYNPRTEPPTVHIKEDRALYWLDRGAQPSDAVQRILAKRGTLERFARLKAGEDLEALVAEFEASETGEAEASVVEIATVAEEEARAEIAAEPEAPTAEETPAEEVEES